jgi:glycosyltransferase involved in cell wall biosynthesis
MPSVTVVIPTARRPQWLRRAIDSCLSGKYAWKTEVVVVANGEDMSWETVRNDYATDGRVHFTHSENPNQNRARNVGLAMARGELIRFLDDDDFLFPDAADRQYAFMMEHKVDCCSAGLAIQDQYGRRLGQLKQPPVASGISAALHHQRLQIPFVHVYRRTSIGDLGWPEELRQTEDIVWLITYMAARERRWGRLDEPVGVWYQHDKPRMSLDRPSGFVHEPTAMALLAARDSLVAQRRWTPELASVVATGLWQCVHRAFAFRPFFWSRIAREALRIDSRSRPSFPMYEHQIVGALPPLLLQWMLLPKRWLRLGFGAIKGLMFGRDYRRTL